MPETRSAITVGLSQHVGWTQQYFKKAWNGLVDVGGLIALLVLTLKYVFPASLFER